MMKVNVWSGDGQTYLGEGELVGYVDVFFFRWPDGSISSQENAEDCPSQEMVDAMKEIGGDVECSIGNPKIVLDDGTVKYGCQVWWERIAE